MSRESNDTISRLQRKIDSMEKDLRRVFQEQLDIEKQDWERQKQDKILQECNKIREQYEQEITVCRQHFTSLEVENQTLTRQYERLKRELE